MLKLFHTPVAQCLYVDIHAETDASKDLVMYEPEISPPLPPKFGETLTTAQQEEVKKLMSGFEGLFRDVPGRVSSTEIHIRTGDQPPVHLQSSPEDLWRDQEGSVGDARSWCNTAIKDPLGLPSSVGAKTWWILEVVYWLQGACEIVLTSHWFEDGMGRLFNTYYPTYLIHQGAWQVGTIIWWHLHRHSNTSMGALRVSVFLRGISYGYLVEKSIRVNMWVLPFLVLGSGPTKSIATLWNGSLMIGSGWSGALAFCFLAVCWHTKHLLQVSEISFVKPGQ